MVVAVKPIIQVAAVNALEIYDFMIYGYYAKYIGQTFFPSSNEYLSLMLALTTFAFGFLARPVGALLLGSYTDRHGRRKGLILSLTPDVRGHYFRRLHPILCDNRPCGAAYCVGRPCVAGLFGRR
jgi:MFS family permease